MYQYKFAEERQHLFELHNAQALAEAVSNMEARLPGLLTDAGIPAEVLPFIMDWNTVVLDCVRFGHLPFMLRLNGSNVVSNSAADPALLAEQHERVVAKYEREIAYFKHPFYQLTQGEDWWPGEPVFLVRDANSFLLHCRYFLSNRFEEVRDWAPKKRGRPRNEAAHADKAEKTGRYKEWIEACRLYKEALQLSHDQLTQSYSSTREQVAEIQRECASRIAAVEQAYTEQRIAHNMLKVQGAPRWNP